MRGPCVKRRPGLFDVSDSRAPNLETLISLTHMLLRTCRTAFRTPARRRTEIISALEATILLPPSGPTIRLHSDARKPNGRKRCKQSRCNVECRPVNCFHKRVRVPLRVYDYQPKAAVLRSRRGELTGGLADNREWIWLTSTAIREAGDAQRDRGYSHKIQHSTPHFLRYMRVASLATEFCYWILVSSTVQTLPNIVKL
jgi:hypothetical protein